MYDFTIALNCDLYRLRLTFPEEDGKLYLYEGSTLEIGVESVEEESRSKLGRRVVKQMLVY